MMRYHHHGKAPLRDDGLVNAAGLFSAAETGDLGWVEQILESEPDLANVGRPEYAQRHRQTKPIHVAALRGHLEVVRLLLDHGADPDAANITHYTYENQQESGTPLIFAISHGHFDAAHLLLDRGARVDYSFLDSAAGIADYACESGDRELFERIIVGGGRLQMGHWLRSRNYPLIGEILDRCPDDPVGDPLGCGDQPTLAQALLELGAWLGDSNVVKMCLQREPKLRDGEGFTLLQQAMHSHNRWNDWEGYASVVRLLLEYGVNPNGRGDRSATLLHLVSTESYWARFPGEYDDEMVAFAGLLLDGGAEVNARDSEMKATPLAWAARYGHRKFVEFLLERGADPNMAEEPWATPLAWAVRYGHAEIAEVLRQHGAR